MAMAMVDDGPRMYGESQSEPELLLRLLRLLRQLLLSSSSYVLPAAVLPLAVLPAVRTAPPDEERPAVPMAGTTFHLLLPPPLLLLPWPAVETTKSCLPTSSACRAFATGIDIIAIVSISVVVNITAIAFCTLCTLCIEIDIIVVFLVIINIVFLVLRPCMI